MTDVHRQQCWSSAFFCLSILSKVPSQKLISRTQSNISSFSHCDNIHKFTAQLLSKLHWFSVFRESHTTWALQVDRRQLVFGLREEPSRYCKMFIRKAMESLNEEAFWLAKIVSNISQMVSSLGRSTCSKVRPAWALVYILNTWLKQEPSAGLKSSKPQKLSRSNSFAALKAPWKDVPFLVPAPLSLPSHLLFHHLQLVLGIFKTTPVFATSTVLFAQQAERHCPIQNHLQ